MTTDLPPPARARKPRYAVTVRRVHALTPRMTRVTFTGEALAAFVWSGPASHIKLVFQPGDSAEAQPVLRTYTPRRFDAAALELEVDFVLHGEGPASTWAAQAAPGQHLSLAGPGRSYAVAPEAQWFLLAGDESALPALATILEALPDHVAVHVLLEVPSLAEVPALDVAHPGAQIQWLPRGADAGRAGSALEAALRERVLPAQEGRIYVACEAGALRRIRRHLLQDRSLPPTTVVTRGYWKLGETNHPDQDYGTDA